MREIEAHADALAKIVNTMDDTTAAKQASSSAPSLPVAGGISIATDGPGDNGSSQVTLGGAQDVHQQWYAVLLLHEQLVRLRGVLMGAVKSLPRGRASLWWRAKYGM